MTMVQSNVDAASEQRKTVEPVVGLSAWLCGVPVFANDEARVRHMATSRNRIMLQATNAA